MNDAARPFDHQGVRTTLDPDGFLLHPEEWSRRMARALADADGVPELTDEHWKVMEFVRGYWQEHGVAPMVRLLCRETEMSLKRIYELFPQGPAHGACKYAGLPRPDGCV